MVNKHFLRIVEIPLKIVHVITSLNDGGAQAVLYNLVKHDAIDEHSVVCLCSAGKYSSRLLSDGIEVVHLDMPRGKIRISGLVRLLNYLRKYPPDLVQTWMYHSDLVGGVVARLAGIKNVVWGLHNSTLDKKATGLSTRLIVWLLRWISWVLPKAIISCSKSALELHVKIGYRAARMRFIANGYDLNQFKPGVGSLNSLEHKPSLLDDTFIFLTVARWDPQKDHRNLIDAVGILTEKSKYRFICLLVGPNINKDNGELNQLIKHRGVDRSFFLCGTSSNVANIMNYSDCHVLPSAFGEAFPNVVAEAMACSLPCIVTNVGDAAEMVGQERWVVEPRSPTALAEAMDAAIKLSKSDADWKKLQSNSRQSAVDNFGVQRMIDGYSGVWREACL